MKAHTAADHEGLADALRKRVLDGPGDTPARLRQAMAVRAAGGDAIEAPFDALARQIGDAAHRITDAQVAALVDKVGERAAFELIVAAATGAGLHRWQAGLAAVDEAAASREARRASA